MYVQYVCVLNHSFVSNSLQFLRTLAHQAPLSMGFARQEYWSGLSFPPPGDLPYPGIELMFSAAPALVGGFFTTGPSEKSYIQYIMTLNIKL